MKVSINEIGMILHGFYLSGYFKSENIEESLEQLIADQRNVVTLVAVDKNSDEKKSNSLKEKPNSTMKTKIFKTNYSYMAIIQAESEEKALEVYQNTVSEIDKSEEKDFISSLILLSSEEAIAAMKDFVAGPEELEQLGKDTAIKLIKEDYNQVLLMEYP